MFWQVNQVLQQYCNSEENHKYCSCLFSSHKLSRASYACLVSLINTYSPKICWLIPLTKHHILPRLLILMKSNRKIELASIFFLRCFYESILCGPTKFSVTFQIHVHCHDCTVHDYAWIINVRHWACVLRKFNFKSNFKAIKEYNKTNKKDTCILVSTQRDHFKDHQASKYGQISSQKEIQKDLNINLKVFIKDYM